MSLSGGRLDRDCMCGMGKDDKVTPRVVTGVVTGVVSANPKDQAPAK